MSGITVFSVPGSPFLASALFTMEELHVPYTFVALHPGELKKEAHLGRHPFGRMPVIEHDGFRLYETQAITRYIAEVFPGEPLLPADARGRARMNQLIGINDCYLFPKFASIAVWERLMKPRLMGAPADEAAIERVMPMGRTCVDEIARLLGDQRYLAGEAFSLADIHLAPQFHYMALTPEGEALLSDHENLRTWLDLMRARPAMKKTMLFGI